MPLNGIIVVVAGILLFFGFAAYLAILSRRAQKIEEAESEQTAAAQSSELTEPIVAAQTVEAQTKSPSAKSRGVAAAKFKTEVEEMWKAKRAIGIEQEAKLSR